MTDPKPCRRWLSLLPVAAGTAVLVAAALAPGPTLGQTPATPTPASSAAGAPRATTTPRPATTAPAPAAPTSPTINPGLPAPAIENEDAVRAILPAAIRDAGRLPVRKWARADMPGAPGGYVVFIATIYHDFSQDGEFVLVNYLQWDGGRWLLGLADYPGVQLQGDDIWLAQYLTDITALASPPAQDYRVFSVGYTVDGPYSPTLTRTETVVQIYDLALTTVWSRVDYLRDVDSSDPNYVLKHGEDVDWVFKDIDFDGIAELIATVTDTDEVILNPGITPVPGVPAPGVTTTTVYEIYKWTNGVFRLQQTSATPAPGPAASPAATPSRTAPPASATPTAAPTSVAPGRTPQPPRAPGPTAAPSG